MKLPTAIIIQWKYDRTRQARIWNYPPVWCAGWGGDGWILALNCEQKNPNSRFSAALSLSHENIDLFSFKSCFFCLLSAKPADVSTCVLLWAEKRDHLLIHLVAFRQQVKKMILDTEKLLFDRNKHELCSYSKRKTNDPRAFLKNMILFGWELLFLIRQKKFFARISL